MNNEIPEQNINWLNEELNEIQSTAKPTELKPALKLEENKVTEIDLIPGAKWDKWVDPVSGVIKKIIPIKYKGQDMVFFINTKNPTYKELVMAAKGGLTHFKIIRMGQAKATRYTLVN